VQYTISKRVWGCFVLVDSSIKYFLDLLLLYELERSDNHAYIIIKNINEVVENHYTLRDATVYNALKRLESEECIAGHTIISTQSGKKRYIYQLTDLGKEKLDALIKDWLLTNHIIGKVIKGDHQNEKH
jgi:PadR family transcriptional regulator PadR